VSNYPDRNVPQYIAAALASYFTPGSTPTHSNLTTVFAAAEIKPDTGSLAGAKESRVVGAFRRAMREQSYHLIIELLIVIRGDHAFRNDQHEAWVERARSAFQRAGWALDADGNVDWDDNLSSYVEPQNRLAAGAVRQVQRAAADRDRATEVALGRSELPTPPRISGGYSEGDVIRVGAASDAAPSVWVTPRIFLVHGHDDHARFEVESFIVRTTGLTPIVLMLEPSRGSTVIEKFEEYADKSSYAVILMTDDDQGNDNEHANASPPQLNSRPRQNVVFEFGYFVGTLRRSHVAALVQPGVERPSDIEGLVYIGFSRGSDWKERLRDEMREAKIPIIR
jgi:hypothetical protein